MFGKGKKNRQSAAGSKSQNILEMFQSLVEDPDDPNSVITMEGKTKRYFYIYAPKIKQQEIIGSLTPLN